jgi:uncharacterized UBP type Zn finger protein
MSLFGNMFDEDGGSAPNGDSHDIVHESKTHNPAASSCGDRGKHTGQLPIAPRPSHGFCGIFNRGATCYLNSLLQV